MQSWLVSQLCHCFAHGYIKDTFVQKDQRQDTCKRKKKCGKVWNESLILIQLLGWVYPFSHKDIIYCLNIKLPENDWSNCRILMPSTYFYAVKNYGHFSSKSLFQRHDLKFLKNSPMLVLAIIRLTIIDQRRLIFRSRLRWMIYKKNFSYKDINLILPNKSIMAPIVTHKLLI